MQPKLTVQERLKDLRVVDFKLTLKELAGRTGPGQALPPPTGTAARPRRPRGGLQSGSAYRCERPGLAAARGHCCQALGFPWRASTVRLLLCRAPASSPVKHA